MWCFLQVGHAHGSIIVLKVVPHWSQELTLPTHALPVDYSGQSNDLLGSATSHLQIAPADWMPAGMVSSQGRIGIHVLSSPHLSHLMLSSLLGCFQQLSEIWGKVTPAQHAKSLLAAF